MPPNITDMTCLGIRPANGFPLLLTDAGLDFFFLEPLRRLRASNMMLGMARVGISSMLKGSKMVVHKVLKKLDDRSLASILDFIEDIIHQPEDV